MEAAGKKRGVSRNGTVTLAQIANHCGVSKGTVSRVLNNRLENFPLSKDTIKRVNQAAEELDYRPNWLARAVRSQRTRLIGLSFFHVDFNDLTPDQWIEENRIMGQISNVIVSHPGFNDYDLVFHDRLEQKGQPLKPSDFKSDLFDGLIYLTPSIDHTEFIDMASKDFPIVLLGQLAGAEKKVPCVDINNREMARRAVSHLIENGRRNILMLSQKKLQNIACIRDRQLGYRDALAEHGMRERIHVIRGLKNQVCAFFKDLPALDKVDGIFCDGDDLAALCIRPLKALGYRIPEDIAMIGFGDSSLSQLTSPPLSSVSRSLDKQVYKAIDLLLKILESEVPYDPGFHEVETDLVVRESTAGNIIGSQSHRYNGCSLTNVAGAAP